MFALPRAHDGFLGQVCFGHGTEHSLETTVPELNEPSASDMWPVTVSRKIRASPSNYFGPDRSGGDKACGGDVLQVYLAPLLFRIPSRNHPFGRGVFRIAWRQFSSSSGVGFRPSGFRGIVVSEEPGVPDSAAVAGPHNSPHSRLAATMMPKDLKRVRSVS